MATYAQVQNGIVVNCIVADATFIANLPNAAEFHEYDETRSAGIGWTWRDDANRAQPPEPADHLGWDEETWQWITPPLEQ